MDAKRHVRRRVEPPARQVWRLIEGSAEQGINYSDLNNRSAASTRLHVVRLCIRLLGAAATFI
jgi:hypothetical protein